VRLYLQRIKAARDGLSAVGIQTDNEELLHISSKAYQKSLPLSASAIRTRDDPISFEKLFVLLQTEEHSMKENLRDQHCNGNVCL
jgi:hypothetical protein